VGEISLDIRRPRENNLQIVGDGSKITWNAGEHIRVPGCLIGTHSGIAPANGADYREKVGHPLGKTINHIAAYPRWY